MSSRRRKGTETTGPSSSSDAKSRSQTRSSSYSPTAVSSATSSRQTRRRYGRNEASSSNHGDRREGGSSHDFSSEVHARLDERHVPPTTHFNDEQADHGRYHSYYDVTTCGTLPLLSTTDPFSMLYNDLTRLVAGGELQTLLGDPVLSELLHRCAVFKSVRVGGMFSPREERFSRWNEGYRAFFRLAAKLHDLGHLAPSNAFDASSDLSFRWVGGECHVDEIGPGDEVRFLIIGCPEDLRHLVTVRVDGCSQEGSCLVSAERLLMEYCVALESDEWEEKVLEVSYEDPKHPWSTRVVFRNDTTVVVDEETVVVSSSLSSVADLDCIVPGDTIAFQLHLKNSSGRAIRNVTNVRLGDVNLTLSPEGITPPFHISSVGTYRLMHNGLLLREFRVRRDPSQAVTMDLSARVGRPYRVLISDDIPFERLVVRVNGERLSASRDVDGMAYAQIEEVMAATPYEVEVLLMDRISGLRLITSSQLSVRAPISLGMFSEPLLEEEEVNEENVEERFDVTIGVSGPAAKNASDLVDVISTAVDDQFGLKLKFVGDPLADSPDIQVYVTSQPVTIAPMTHDPSYLAALEEVLHRSSTNSAVVLHFVSVGRLRNYDQQYGSNRIADASPSFPSGVMLGHLFEKRIDIFLPLGGDCVAMHTTAENDVIAQRELSTLAEAIALVVKKRKWV